MKECEKNEINYSFLNMQNFEIKKTLDLKQFIPRIKLFNTYKESKEEKYIMSYSVNKEMNGDYKASKDFLKKKEKNNY